MKLQGLLFILLLIIPHIWLVNEVSALIYPSGCLPPNGVPSSCMNNFEPDFSCTSKAILDPSTVCCPNKCKGVGPSNIDPVVSNLINVFGTRFDIQLSSAETVSMFINLLITTVLGLMSVYTLFRSIYLAAFVRTSTTDSAKIESVSKDIKNLLIGFLLGWVTIFAVQVLSVALGLGSLANLDITDPTGSGTFIITIR